MGIEYRTAQLEFREILSKLQPVFVSAFMLWLDNKVAEYKMFGDVQLKDFEDEDVWYSFPAWCEEQLYTLSNPTVQSTSRSTVSWQRLRQQHRQRLSCLSGEQCRPAKKRKLHVNYDSEGNNFPVIVNVTSNNEIYENVAVPGATDAERQSEVPVPQETLVVRRSDDTPDIDSESGLFTNTGTVIQSETDHGNGQDDEIPIEIHRKQSSVAANAESDSRSEGVVEKESVVIKIEPGDYSNSPCDKLIDSNVSHVISPVSGYSSSSNPYHEKLDISSSQKDQSRTSTENIVNSVLLQNRAGPSGASVSQHLQIPTVTQFSPSVISDQVMDEDSRGLKKEPVDDDYMSAGGSGGDYSVFEDSLAADSVTENSSMYLDPDIISNVSNQPEQGTIRIDDLPLPLPSKPLIGVRNREARKLASFYVRCLVRSPRVGYGNECRRPPFWPHNVPWMKRMYHLSTDQLKTVIGSCISYCGYRPESYYQGGSISKISNKMDY